MSHYLSIPLVLSIAAGTSLSAGRFNFSTKLLLNKGLSETSPYGSDTSSRACWEMCPPAKPIVPDHPFCENNCPEFYKSYDKYFREDFKRLIPPPADRGCLSALSYSFYYMSEESDVEIPVKCFLICPPIDDIGSFCLNNCREYVRCYANDLNPTSSAAAMNTSTPSHPIETPVATANEIDRSRSSVAEHDSVSITTTSTLTQLHIFQNNHNYMTLLFVVVFGSFGIVLSALGVLAVVMLKRKRASPHTETVKTKLPSENTEASLIPDNTSYSNISDRSDLDRMGTLRSDHIDSLENLHPNADSCAHSEPRAGWFFQSRTNR